MVKVKHKFHPLTCHEGTEGKQRDSSTRCLTSALDGGGWLTPRSDRFTPDKETWYPFHSKLGDPRAIPKGAENTATQGFDPLTFKPVESRYTEYAIPAHGLFTRKLFIGVQQSGKKKRRNKKKILHLFGNSL